MGRLISPPTLLPIDSMEPLSGPQTIGASAGTSDANFTQTVATYSALWRWQFSLAAMRGRMAREFRGWITALHGGANATRFHFYDPDRLSYKEAGINGVTFQKELSGMPWSNGLPWSNRQNWGIAYPPETVTAAADRDATIISLGNTAWGRKIGMGSMIGFFPSHFGMYMVTQVMPTPGQYRIWPPLRKALLTSDYATLNPTLVMRLEGMEAANMPRGLQVIEGASFTLVEVMHYDVVDYFTE